MVESLTDNLPKGDIRRQLPKFQPEVIGKNLEMAEELEKQARNKGCSPALLALAWIKQQSGKPALPEIIPIPGATAKRVVENVQVVTLGQSDLKEIDRILKRAAILGDGYDGSTANLSNGRR